MSTPMLEHTVELPLAGYWTNLWRAVRGKNPNKMKVIVSCSAGAMIHGIYWMEGHEEVEL